MAKIEKYLNEKNVVGMDMDSMVYSKKESAVERYKKNEKEIEKLLKSITTKLKKHKKGFSKKPLDWGYVGDLGYVMEKLEDINDHFRS